jgi:predicted SAM-dependent methyltransferase
VAALVLVGATAVFFRAHVYALRHDVRLLYHQKVKNPTLIREYWDTHPVKKLQLGAGENYADGWLNTDIEPRDEGVYLDAASEYPFPGESVHFVFAEHLIEHLPWEGGLEMLKESRRVLVPGGQIRIVTPNLEKLIGLLNNDSAESREVMDAHRRVFGWPDTPVMPAYVFNKGVREWGHQFIYDPATLRKTFEMAGFREIVERRIGDATDPTFEAVEFRTRERNEDLWLMNRWGAMAFEAVR